MIKALKKIRNRNNFLNLIKGIYENPTTNIMLNDERLNFPPNQEQDKKVHSQHSIQN